MLRQQRSERSHQRHQLWQRLYVTSRLLQERKELLLVKKLLAQFLGNGSPCLSSSTGTTAPCSTRLATLPCTNRLIPSLMRVRG